MSDMHHDDHPHDDLGHAAPTAKPAAQRMMMKNMGKGLALAIGGILLVILIVTTVGLYRWQWDNPVTDAVIHALPYPAATVNGKVVRYSEYADDLDTVRRFFTKQQEQAVDGQQVAMPSEEELRKGVLDRLIQTEILKEEAARYEITVSDEEINAEYAKISSEGDGEAEAQIKELYGWTPEQFKEKVLRTYLMQAKLAESVAKDESLGAESKTKAEEALQKIKDGADFAEIAKEYSDDTVSAMNGGELGTFAKGAMVPEFENAAFALKKGEMSDVVQSQFGWHIILVTDVKGEEISASHILVAGPSLDTYLKAKLDAAKITRYIKI